MIPPASNCRSSSFDIVDGVASRVQSSCIVSKQESPDATEDCDLKPELFLALTNVASSLFEKSVTEHQQTLAYLEEPMAKKQKTEPRPWKTKIHYKRMMKTTTNREAHLIPETSTAAATTTTTTITSSKETRTNPAPAAPRQAIIPSFHPSYNLYSSTREGFLFRLRSILDDPLQRYSNQLSWMPNQTSFAIRSSTSKFVKSGNLSRLFGIQKMSSFLRRLQQLGFCRIRDVTDPTNLDVFSKPGFVSMRKSRITAKESPSPKDQRDDTNETATTQTKAPMDPVPSTPLPTASTSSIRTIESSSSKSTQTVSPASPAPSSSSFHRSESVVSSSWVCATPKQEQQQHQGDDEKRESPRAPSGNASVKAIVKFDPALPLMPLLPTEVNNIKTFAATTIGNNRFDLRPRNETYDATKEDFSPLARASSKTTWRPVSTRISRKRPATDRPRMSPPPAATVRSPNSVRWPYAPPPSDRRHYHHRQQRRPSPPQHWISHGYYPPYPPPPGPPRNFRY